MCELCVYIALKGRNLPKTQLDYYIHFHYLAMKGDGDKKLENHVLKPHLKQMNHVF